MYLSEYARRTRRRLKPILETLAGDPERGPGLLRTQVIRPDIVQKLFATSSTFTIMAAGIGVGILTIPLVASVAEDAMYAVPGALREAAYGIGARRRTVTTKVVFPAAVSGIVASLILGFSRAIGETMVVAIAAGARAAAAPFNPSEPGQTMTGAIASLAIGSDQVKSATGLNPFDALYLVGLLLFAMTLGVEPAVRALRPPRAEGLLMAAIAPTAQVRAPWSSPSAARERDIAGRVFQGRAAPVAAPSLLILIVLLGTALSAAWPVVSTRLGDFLTSDVSRCPRERGCARASSVR